MKQPFVFHVVKKYLRSDKQEYVFNRIFGTRNKYCREALILMGRNLFAARRSTEYCIWSGAFEVHMCLNYYNKNYMKEITFEVINYANFANY